MVVPSFFCEGMQLRNPRPQHRHAIRSGHASYEVLYVDGLDSLRWWQQDIGHPLRVMLLFEFLGLKDSLRTEAR